MAIVGVGKATAWALLAVVMESGLCSPVSLDKEQTAQTTASLSHVYQKWLDEDVRWIITPEERAAFLRLSQNEERNNFVREFWLRRNPIPSNTRNIFKEEHYRRIAFANVHFQWQAIPGWQTDRGRTYIVLGPPSSINAAAMQNTGNSSTPTELWHYHLVTGDRDFSFSDRCRCGDFRLNDSQTKP